MSESDRLLIDELQSQVLSLQDERLTLKARLAGAQELLSIALERLHAQYRASEEWRPSYIAIEDGPDVDIPRGMLTWRDIPWAE